MIDTRSLMHTQRSWARGIGVLCAAVLMLVSGCGEGGSTEEAQASDEQACASRDETVFEIAEGSGEPTPDDALAAIDDAELPDGEPELTEPTEDGRVEWLFFDAGEETGSAVAVLQPWGLWTIETVTRCV